jgi:GNAT superfamily N-acetyltransferase
MINPNHQIPHHKPHQKQSPKMPVYHHPPTSHTLQSALKSSLPYSINLVYRTHHQNRTEHANILATFSPEETTIPKCWAVAYFDRSMRPETETWIFAAGEQPNHSTEEFCPQCKKAVLMLLHHMSTLPTPPMRKDNQPALDVAYQHEKEYPTPGPDGIYPPHPGTYMRHLLLPKVVLVGACHEQIVKIFHDTGLVRRDFPGGDLELSKFVFKLSDLPTTRELPEGLRWGRMREQDIETVKARTHIPRSTKTLLSLESVGVFDEESDKAVAWTFLGVDGSLTTLHTEPEYRGKGIGKAVADKIIRDYAPGLAVDDEGQAWCHADVYKGNVQSESLCRSLGGKALWKDYWVRIDLEASSLSGSSQ